MELNGLNSKIDPFIFQTDTDFFVSDRRRSNWIVLMRIAARLKRDANLEKMFENNVWVIQRFQFRARFDEAAKLVI